MAHLTSGIPGDLLIDRRRRGVCVVCGVESVLAGRQNLDELPIACANCRRLMPLTEDAKTARRERAEDGASILDALLIDDPGDGIRPYYADEYVTLYHGDMREILPSISADVVISAPPYNRGLTYGASVNDARADYRDWCASWFSLLSAPAIAFTCGHQNLSMWCGIREPDWIMCWWKPGAIGASPFGVSNWEPILFWGDAGKRKDRVDVVRARIIPIPDSALGGHPCPKPDMWALGLVEMLSERGETVLDPFAGTGTTLVAAKRLGRKAIGIEIEERYCAIAVERLRQGVLFDLSADEVESGALF